MLTFKEARIVSKRRRIDGVDLSHHQVGLNIDWHEAKKAGVKFVYHKASEGTSFIDSAYAGRRKEARRHNVAFGGYHFAHPEPGNAVDEAKHFLKVADPKPGDMAPALDLEVNEHKMSEDQLALWVHTWFHAVWHGAGFKGKQRRGVLYTPFNLTSHPRRVGLWVARYNDDNRPPVVRKPFKHWSIWQFSDGRFGVPSAVPGIGHVDVNTLHRVLKKARVRWLKVPVPVVKKPKPAKESEIDRMVRIAKSQIGYHEGRSGGHWNNIQKYSPAVPGLEWSQGQPWCCTFVSWLAMKAGLAAYFPRTASTDAAAAWWKARKQWHEYPAVGAQALYGKAGNMDHTGFVVDYDDTYVYAVEGNTNTTGSREGDGVYLKKRLRRSDYVQGYGYPDVPGGLKSADPNYKRSK